MRSSSSSESVAKRSRRDGGWWCLVRAVGGTRGERERRRFASRCWSLSSSSLPSPPCRPRGSSGSGERRRLVATMASGPPRTQRLGARVFASLDAVTWGFGTLRGLQRDRGRRMSEKA